jgi:hypothetical protein
MNSKNAVERIMKVLGLTSQSFYEAKTEQGMSVKMEGELEVGQPIYVSTEEGMIPAPAGVHKLDDGTEIEVDDEGKVSKIKMGGTEDAKIEDEKDAEDIKDEDMSAVELEFGDVKLKDGSIIRIGNDDPEVGIRVMKVNYNNTLTALTDGDYETADGKVISIIGGSIHGVQSKADYEKRGTGLDAEKKDPLADIGKAMANVFTEAKTVQGDIKLDSPTFDIGEPIDVVKEDGTKEKAPDGEHEIILKDSKGNDVKIRVVVKDGKITERENVEEAQPESEDEKMAEIASMFAAALKKFETKIDAIASKQNELDTKFKKFSKEPAGSRVYTQKTINEQENPLESKYEAFRRMREMIKN